MLYFLLVVIAVGVLLISPAGKKVLKWTAISAVVAAILAATAALLFWVWGYNQILAVILGLAILAGVIKIFGLDK